jgi:hypothetical protein
MVQSAAYMPSNEEEAEAYKQLFHIVSHGGAQQSIGGAEAVKFIVSSGKCKI